MVELRCAGLIERGRHLAVSCWRSPAARVCWIAHERVAVRVPIALLPTSGVGRGGKGAWMRVQARGFPYAFAYIFRFRGAQNHTVTTAKLRELSRPDM